jgi:hypothetical protein
MYVLDAANASHSCVVKVFFEGVHDDCGREEMEKFVCCCE